MLNLGMADVGLVFYALLTVACIFYDLLFGKEEK